MVSSSEFDNSSLLFISSSDILNIYLSSIIVEVNHLRLIVFWLIVAFVLLVVDVIIVFLGWLV